MNGVLSRATRSPRNLNEGTLLGVVYEFGQLLRAVISNIRFTLERISVEYGAAAPIAGKIKNPDAPAVRRLEEEDWNG
jgi:hypothetical protein